MKREVWVESLISDETTMLLSSSPMGIVMNLKKITLHESRWIPVSERMPTVAEHYLVVRLDRLDWCYCEIEDLRPGQIQFNPGQDTVSRFTSKGVTHWLEAPPLPVAKDEFQEAYLKYCYSFKSITDVMQKESIESIAQHFWELGINAAKESKCV